MLINIVDTKNAIDPSQDFPLKSGVPNFMPMIAATESDMINTNQEVIVSPLEKNKQLIKNPSAI